jgi:hypothetical protein
VSDKPSHGGLDVHFMAPPKENEGNLTLVTSTL